MNEPITAHVALPCLLRSASSLELLAEGATIELAREALVLRLAGGGSAYPLRPELAVLVDIALPALEGRPGRYLECAAKVRSMRTTGAEIQILLDVAAMNFIGPRTAAGGRPLP